MNRAAPDGCDGPRISHRPLWSTLRVEGRRGFRGPKTSAVYQRPSRNRPPGVRIRGELETLTGVLPVKIAATPL